MTLLKMSIYGAVMVLAILLIRAFTLHKLPKKTFLILWAVTLVRLLVPFEISSGFSIYSLLPEEISIAEETEPYVPDPENPYEPFENYADYLKNQGKTQISKDDTIIVEPDGGTIYLPNENPDAEAIPLPDMDKDAQYADGIVLPENETAVSGTRTSFLSVASRLQVLWNHLLPSLPVLWSIGALLCAAFFLVSYIRCYLEFHTSLPITEDYAADWLKQHPLKRTIAIRQSDKISAPLTYGIFRPVILMPKKTDWNNHAQLDYVLYHEFTHIRRFDLAAKLVMIVAVCLHWFNPFVWLMYFFFNRDLELSCDDCVVKHFNESRADYANTLIDMEEKKNYGAPLCNHFSKNAIDERITAIMKSKKTTIGMVVTAIILVAVVIVTLTTGRKESDVTTDITPTVTPAETATPAPSAEPTPPPGNIIYLPETNYTYSNEDSPAIFDYDSSTISPKDGYDFVISNFVSEEGQTILSGLTLHLEDYAGNTAWWCLAAFYDKDPGNVYLEFVPAAGVEAAPAGILHVTIPVASPTEYTVQQAGNFEEQKSSAFWFSDICKIKNRIYFNNGSHEGSLWVYDITTGEMSSLAYVNEKMQEIANELCSGFGWEHEPAIWFNVSKQVGADTYVYTADVCKEMDTETIYSLGLWYEGEQFVDFGANYHGSSGQPPSTEELASLCQEQFYRYRDMQAELFDTNLKCADLITSEDWVTINGRDGYTKVLDERFPTLQSVIDYMETVCTPEYARVLRNQNWKMNTQNPTLAELDGELYTKCYDAVSPNTSYSFAPISYDGPDTCTLSYEAYIGIPSNKTESGTVTFRCIDGNWYVNYHTYTYYHDFVDAFEVNQLTELFQSYIQMEQKYEKRVESLDCGYYSHLQLEKATINGVGGYYKVIDERFPTLQSVLTYLETMCTPDYAKKLFNEFWYMDSDAPLLAELNGELYTQNYHSSTNDYPDEFYFSDIKYTDAETIVVTYYSKPISGVENLKLQQTGTMTFRLVDHGWRVAEHTYSLGSVSTDDLIYEEELMYPSHTSPDWYGAVEELLQGLTPENTTVFPSGTYIPDSVMAALQMQAVSYLKDCGLGTNLSIDFHALCKTNGITVYQADVSAPYDAAPDYFTIYHAYDGNELIGKVILLHLISFYDSVNLSGAWRNYIRMDDVVQIATEEFEKFYTAKSYTQPYTITSIHMISNDTIQVDFRLTEDAAFNIYTECTVTFTYDYSSETWLTSSFRETPPDYLSSHAEFPTLPAEDVFITGTDWCFTFLDELELPRFSELMSLGAANHSGEPSDSFNIGWFHTIALDGIHYFFLGEDAPADNDPAWNLAITSTDYPLSGGATVGMTGEELLTLYPDLAKTSLTWDDPAIKGTYGSDHFAFRDNQFPKSFLETYEYAYVAYLDKGRDGLPVCIAFLIKNNVVGAITVYMPTAG